MLGAAAVGISSSYGYGPCPPYFLSLVDLLSASNILSLQMYWKPTSSGSCGETGLEKAVVATQSCRWCCNVTA